MTRFQPNGARIALRTEPSEKPFNQMVGLYNMWQSLSPSTRKAIADWFSRTFGSQEAPVTEDQMENAADIMGLMNYREPVKYAQYDDGTLRLDENGQPVELQQGGLDLSLMPGGLQVTTPDEQWLQNRDAASVWMDRAIADQGLRDAATTAGVKPVLSWGGI